MSSTSTKHGALVVFGSGPGVGRNVAALFAERGFQKVILMSRNATRLGDDAQFVRSASAATTVHEIPVDAGNLEHVRASLPKVDECLKETPLECVLYNAARLGKSLFFDYVAEDLGNDLNISVTSLYAVAQWAMPQLLKTGESMSTGTPSLLVTSGMLAKDPFPAMFSLATCKAGQHSLVHSLHKEFEPKGVHCALIVIAGSVSDDSKVTNARNIAEETWKTFCLPKGKGHLENLIEDPAFLEHVKNRER